MDNIQQLLRRYKIAKIVDNICISDKDTILCEYLFRTFEIVDIVDDIYYNSKNIPIFQYYDKNEILVNKDIQVVVEYLWRKTF